MDGSVAGLAAVVAAIQRLLQCVLLLSLNLFLGHYRAPCDGVVRCNEAAINCGRLVAEKGSHR